MSTTTTNFGITLPEGADTFNPLIYNNDAFTLIDSVMRTIKNVTVGSANQVLSENVNTITRTDSNINTFIFIASSDYETTQDFYVDDVPVTARYSDGSVPNNGAYRTNQAVLCYLNGNILTLFTARMSPASDVAYDNNKSKLVSNNVQGAIDELNSGLQSDYTTLDNKINNLIKTEVKTTTITLAANQGASFNISCAKDGYTCIGVVSIVIGAWRNDCVIVHSSALDSSTWRIGLRNLTGNAINNQTMIVNFLYVKTA